MKAEPEVVTPADSQAPDYLPARATSFKAHLARAAFIALAIGVLFWRVFLFGETLIDVNTLNNQLPWGYSAGQSDYPYNRRDLTDTYVTRDYFVVQAYRDGELPLWNPYTMAGLRSTRMGSHELCRLSYCSISSSTSHWAILWRESLN